MHLVHKIEKMCSYYASANLELDTNDAEKYKLIQQIEMLSIENNMIKSALKEIANRLNAGGQGLLGGFNF